jgi:hypothetical protein
VNAKSIITQYFVRIENLDVLEALFDFYFVQPELLKKKREALNAKLKKAGKPEMK